MRKPDDVFARDHEWRALDRWVRADAPGATLGLTYGRRRQGKTYLLQALAETHGGLYFSALKQSTSQNLERLARAYEQHTDSRAPVAFSSWDEALDALLALGDGAKRPVPVVIDELPYLLEGAPELPSLLQSKLAPRGRAARSWRTRLVLCGSAFSTMRGLLAGTAPLRGRASLELVVHPFDHLESAEFWGVSHEPELAARLHALVGGTPAYRVMCGGTAPSSLADLDDWVVDVLLDPASAMFREGSVLLAEEDRAVDTALYFAVLAAVSQGRTRRGEIAAAVGRSETALGHPLTVLTGTRLLTALDDALRQRRTSFRISEPALRFNRLVIAPNEDRLARQRGADVWREVADTVSAHIYGPHFEDLARAWCAHHADARTLGGRAGTVAPTEVACREHRVTHQVDVVAVERPPNAPRRVLAVGEAKWRTTPCDLSHLARLDHVRDLVDAAPGTRLLLFSRLGFTRGLLDEAARRPDVELVDLDRLYAGA